MRIDGISFIPASRKMANQDILEEIRRLSAPGFNGDLSQAIHYIQWMLEEVGSRTRYWFSEGERPLDFMLKACKEAMDRAGCRPDDVDLLIYASNCRGFLEPGDAYFIARELGMDAVHCFDIVDACMAWTRACDVAQSYFRSGRYRTAMIVNGESFYLPGGVAYPSNFSLKGMRDIAYCFSAYCGGDGVSATVLRADAERPWTFHYLSDKTTTDLCTIPLEGHSGRSAPSDRIGLNGLGAFTSFSSQVFNHAHPFMVNVLRMLEPFRDDIRHVFAHTGGSLPIMRSWAEEAGFGDLMRFIFPDYGNLGAASIPASIALYAGDGLLERGDRFGFWMGSSGMSVASATLIY